MNGTRADCLSECCISGWHREGCPNRGTGGVDAVSERADCAPGCALGRHAEGCPNGTGQVLRIDFDICPVGKPDKRITVSGALVDTDAERVFVPPEIFDVITKAADTEIGEIHGGEEARYSIGPGTLVYRGKRRTLDVARGEPGEEPIFGVMGLEAFGLALDPAARRADRRLAFRKTRKR